ncbi:MAG: hypothetical protein EP343_32660 [Deltaproteobacteria bacterium]|nr:MAG: hypothetical protein EP343_32660 [Deltaproteobacteria bacterium]
MPHDPSKNKPPPQTHDMRSPPPIELDLRENAAAKTPNEPEFDPVAVRVGCVILLGMLGAFVFLMWNPFSGKQNHDSNVKLSFRPASMEIQAGEWFKPNILLERRSLLRPNWSVRTFHPQRYSFDWTMKKPHQASWLQAQGAKIRLVKSGTYTLQLCIRSIAMVSEYRVDRSLLLFVKVRD